MSPSKSLFLVTLDMCDISERLVGEFASLSFANTTHWNHLGSVLAEGDNRSKVFLATKFGNTFDAAGGKPIGKVRGESTICIWRHATLIDFCKGDAAYIRQAIEDSISRLGTTPDLYYQHRVDPNVCDRYAYALSPM